MAINETTPLRTLPTPDLMQFMREQRALWGDATWKAYQLADGREQGDLSLSDEGLGYNCKATTEI